MDITCRAPCSTRPSNRLWASSHTHGARLDFRGSGLMGCAEGWVKVPEPWLPRVVTCQGWSHGTDFQLAIRPSPNLPSTTSIDLYPSLCLFEPTVVSVGRGTPHPFESLGHPSMGLGSFEFTPVSTPRRRAPPQTRKRPMRGSALGTTRRHVAHRIVGRVRTAPTGLHLDAARKWAQRWVAQQGSLGGFITSPSFFDKLAGTDALRLALESGTPLAELNVTWKAQQQPSSRPPNRTSCTLARPLPGR